jgi:hypothetical protein
MYSFLVLGIVPGTNIQITFEDWRNIFVSFLSIAVLVHIFKNQRAGTAPLPMRRPLHAATLHLRG